MGATSSNCLSLCANSSSSRKRELDSDEILDRLGIGNLKEIKRTNMMEDSLADKLATKHSYNSISHDRNIDLSVIEEEASQNGATPRHELQIHLDLNKKQRS